MIQSEIIVRDLYEPTSIQLDEDHHALYALGNAQLFRFDLTDNDHKPQIVCQHNRKLLGIQTNSDDEHYSQGESDDDRDIPRVTDPYDDSEPSTDDDEESSANRRSWRRDAWRPYKFDNPCSILFLPNNHRFIVLNEGVITILSIEMENGRPFVQGASQHIFCYEYDIFQNKQSIQPWSIAPTAIDGIFVFSLLDSPQLYIIDIRQDKATIDHFMSVSITWCPTLLFHSLSNRLLVYDNNQVWAISMLDKSVMQLTLPKPQQENAINSITIDKQGYIYVLSNGTIFKYQWETHLQLVESFNDSKNTSSSYLHLIVSNAGDEFYLSNMNSGSIDRWKKT